jgi:hypothetical protein
MDGKRKILIVSFPHCIHEKAWEWKVRELTAFQLIQETKLEAPCFSWMQWGKLAMGILLFLSIQKKTLNFHMFPVMS